jgi:hypothetical protein
MRPARSSSTSEERRRERTGSPIGRLPTKVIFPMAAASAIAVATIYYNQPLLPSVAKSFGHPVGEVGKIATATQLGYPLGLFLFVPLGDWVDRPLLLVCNMVSLVLWSAAPRIRRAAGSLGVRTRTNLLPRTVPCRQCRQRPPGAAFPPPRRPGFFK